MNGGTCRPDLRPHRAGPRRGGVLRPFRSAATVAAVLATTATAAGAAGPLRYTGVNMAGGEFKGGRLPGKPDKDFHYPRAKEFQPFADAGMNAVRVPVIWRRLQPNGGGELDPVALRALDKSLGALEPQVDLVILDIHNYGRLGGVPLTDDPALAGALPDLWRRLALRYAGRPKIAFGLMNEPHDMDAVAWRAIAERTVAAIRQAGARNLVLVPGVDWTGAHSWMRANAAAFTGFRDPADAMLFEMHQYLDADSSGTHADCPDPGAGPSRLAAATRWLRQQHRRALLAEFGAPGTPQCLQALDGLLGYLDANGDAWAGWTYWAAGAWWGKYPLSVQPGEAGDKPQMAVLRRHVARR